MRPLQQTSVTKKQKFFSGDGGEPRDKNLFRDESRPLVGEMRSHKDHFGKLVVNRTDS